MCLCGCVFICVRTCLLVLSLFHVCMYVCTGASVHMELFVAGLAPWEPIFHLSIPHSRAQRSPDFTQNLPAADPFSQWHHRPHYLEAWLSTFSLLSHSRCLLYSLSLFFFLAESHEVLSLLSVCSFTHAGIVTVAPTHTRL